MILHQEVLVCLPRLGRRGEALVRTTKHQTVTRSHWAVSEDHHYHLQLVLGQQGLESVFTQVKDALQRKLHPIVAESGNLSHGLLQAQDRAASLVTVSLLENPPECPVYLQLHC